MIANCPECDSFWRVRGLEPGQKLYCPFCSSKFEFEPVSDETVFISRDKLDLDEDTKVGEKSDEILLSKMEIPSGMTIKLKGLNGPPEGEIFELENSRVTIGRNSGDIQLDDPQVSRKHCAIEVYGDSYILLKDLASTNGTLVNDRMITSTKISDGDEIQMGLTRFRLIVEED